MYKTIQPPCGRGNAPLLVAGATTFPRWGDFILRYALSDERGFAVFYSAPCIDGSPARPDRGGERSEPVSRIVFMSYDTESKSRNADFISIAAERQSATLGAKGPVKLTNPWTEGPSILRTLFMQPFYTTRGASRAPFLKLRRQPPPPPSEPF